MVTATMELASVARVSLVQIARLHLAPMTAYPVVNASTTLVFAVLVGPTSIARSSSVKMTATEMDIARMALACAAPISLVGTVQFPFVWATAVTPDFA